MKKMINSLMHFLPLKTLKFIAFYYQKKVEKNDREIKRLKEIIRLQDERLKLFNEGKKK